MKNKFDIRYCITCEEMVNVEHSDLPWVLPHHLKVAFVDGIPEIDACEGEFASCPPPELNEEVWDSIFATEPK